MTGFQAVIRILFDAACIVHIAGFTFFIASWGFLAAAGVAHWVGFESWARALGIVFVLGGVLSGVLYALFAVLLAGQVVVRIIAYLWKRAQS